MAIASDLRKRRRSGGGRPKSQFNIETSEGLAGYAASLGYTKEAKRLLKPPKISLFQRLGRILTAFEPANAAYEARYNNASFLKTYGKDIYQDTLTAFTGFEQRTTERKRVKEILMQEGWKDRPGKIDAVDVAGLAGDILTDPTTFFGNPILKGLKFGTKTAFKGAKKLPVIGRSLKAGQESVSELFTPFYKMKKDMVEAGMKPAQADEYIKNYVRWAKKSRAEVDEMLGEVQKRVKSSGKIVGKKNFDKFMAKVRKAIDKPTGEAAKDFVSPVGKGDDLLDEIVDYIKTGHETMLKKEQAIGIPIKGLRDYMHHVLTPEAAQLQSQNLLGEHLVKAGITDKLQAAKHQTILKYSQRGTKNTRIGKSTLQKGWKYVKDIGGYPMYKDSSGKFWQSSKATVDEINGQFQKQYGFNLFEGDAFKAFASRNIKSIKALETEDFFQRIGKMKGVVKQSDELTKIASELPVEQTGLWDKATGIHYSKIPQGISKSLGDDIYMPSQITKHIDEIHKILVNDEATNEFLKVYDKALGYWKASVTGYFPSFHTRNAIGGTFNNWLAGVNNPARYKIANDIVRGKAGHITKKSGEKVSYDTVRELMKEWGISGQTGILDVPEFLHKKLDPTTLQRFTSKPQKVMGFFEDRMRGALFVDRLVKGATEESAAKTVMKYHFDYMPEGFTKFERLGMRRLIPFYTWTRHNIPLQIEQLFAQPGKYAGVMKVRNAFGPQTTSEEEQILPSWLRERFTIRGEGGYWTGLGLPLEEAVEKIADPLRGLGLSLSPFVKVPVEQMTGYNIFKDRKITEDVYGKHYRNIPRPIRDWLQVKEHKSKSGEPYWTMNPKRKYWLEVIGARGLSTAVKSLNYAGDDSDWKAIASLMTTISKYEYSAEELRTWSEKEKMEELEELLRFSGALKDFTRTFIPSK